MANVELRLNPARDIQAIKALRLNRNTTDGLLTDPVTGFSSRNRRDVFNRAAAVTPCLTVSLIRRRLRKGWTLRDAMYTNACGTGSGSAFTSALASGLVNYWKLDEASGSRLNSVGTDALTESGTVESATGKRGLAANGNNQQDYLLTAAPIAVANPLTFALWYNAAGYGAPITPLLDAGSTEIEVNNTGGVRFTGTGTAFITIPIGALNTWHLIVLTIDASNIWNGSVDGGNFVTNNGIANSATSVFSIIGKGTPLNINGMIDEVAHWNRTLSQQEVIDLWNGGTGRFL